MKIKAGYPAFCILLCVFESYAQCVYHIQVLGTGGEPIPHAHVFINGKIAGTTNINGFYSLNMKESPIEIAITYIGYEKITDTLRCGSSYTPVKKKYVMQEKSIAIGTVVVSASKIEKPVFNVPASIQVIKEENITNKAKTTLEDLIPYTSGVSVWDGQMSIRGGSGFSYGAGSRVIYTLNDFPMLSGDVSDIKWSFIPLEMISRVEIIKGGASVLYGSSALNGIMSVYTEGVYLQPPDTPIYSISINSVYGVFGNPHRKSNIWWRNGNPTTSLLNLTTQTYQKYFSVKAGFHYLDDEGYRYGENEKRLRGTIFMNLWPLKNKELQIYGGAGMQAAKGGVFLLWANADSSYWPLGGIDTPSTSLTLFTTYRGFYHAKVSYSTEGGNRYTARFQHYYTNNITHNTQQSSISNLYYGEAQVFLSKGLPFSLNSGIAWTRNRTEAQLFGNHLAHSLSFYSMLAYTLKDLMSIEGGLRLERFVVDTIATTHDKLPFFSVFKGGIALTPLPFMNIRASYSGGYRFPSIAELFTSTSVSSLHIFPNPQLKPEISHSFETGLRLFLVKERKAKIYSFIDIAIFYSRYLNMIEYNFGVFLPDTVKPPVPLQTLLKYIGFKPLNTEEAIVKGMEIVLNLNAKLPGSIVNGVSTSLGYTYTLPYYDKNDTIYIATLSNKNSKFLKYRNKHLFTWEMSISNNFLSIDFYGMLRTRFENIDTIFIERNEFLPGFRNYWEKYNSTEYILNLMITTAIKPVLTLSFIIENLTNSEIMGRPGDIQPPRTFKLQLNYKLGSPGS